VVQDYHATGNQIIDRICDETPPGFRNRVMGVQNIKGTGLDFVYRWEAWSACHRACALVRDADPAKALHGLRELAAFQDYGVLTEEYVRETVALARQRPWAQREEAQAQLQQVIAHLDEKMATIREGLGRGSGNAGWLAWLLGLAEGLLDAGDAVRRRRQADRVYRDLVAERMGRDRAVLELQALTGRQKGGWLLKKVSGFWRGLFGGG
jgi:gamma-polyglutamate synthase